jgi:NTE family protein
MSDSLLEGLRRSALLAGLPAALVEALACAAEPVELGGGEVLFRQGDPGDALYFVLSGRLRVERAYPGGVAVMAEIVAGESVGEMAALTGDARSATVTAIRNCRLARLKRDAFERMLAAHPQLLAPFVVLLARRLGAARPGQTRKAASCLTLLAGCDGLDVAAVAARLGAALERLGKVAVVRVAELESGAHPEHGAAAADFAEWAHRLEQAHDFVLFAVGGEAAEWARLCMRQADLVLVCADPARTPSARETRAAALPAWANVGLVLCGADGAVPRTQDWLDAFPGAVHFNVRLAAAADFERLARLVSGRGVGLVLGGGGARGMAHIGVIRALAEAGIPIDRIGGTSQGALVAATYAIGWDHRRMLEEFGRFRQDNPTNDFTVPTVSLIAGKKAERALKSRFGERRIEDLPVDFFCVSSSLTSGQPFVHRRGLLREALRATISIPGIFPPVPREGELLVDGGVLDNLPIGPMRQRGEIRVIAVNVTFARGLAPRRAPPPKRAHFLPWGRAKPDEPHYRLPTIVQTLMQAGTLGTIARLDALRHAADLFVEPPVSEFRTLDWERVADIAELGYRAAREALAKWNGGKEPPSR